MRWLVRRVVLWAMPELHATVERERWISAFWQAAAAQHEHVVAQQAPAPAHLEVN